DSRRAFGQERVDIGLHDMLREGFDSEDIGVVELVDSDDLQQDRWSMRVLGMELKKLRQGGFSQGILGVKLSFGF
ncbi:MAG TPA: hypothetical protein VMS96_09635, partial [Terriglobales bacterium]|nr:hypothetical protein [Terriglobales bacterium]